MPARSGVAPSAPAPAAAAADKQPVTGKWSPVLYGFLESDLIHDSTESFNDLAGNAAIAPKSAYGGNRGRTMMGVRNSRLGIKLSGPTSGDLKVSGQVEVDFLGNQASSPESTFFTSPLLRIRHFFVKFENPYVDLLAGQYWQLFGWQSYFHPNTVEMQGVPGQVYSRGPQLRLSHTFKTEPVNIDIAIAASRPAQRDSEVPDGQAGLRLSINGWKGVHTAGATGTSVDPLAIGVSAIGRRFGVANFAAKPTHEVKKTGWGVSFDGLIPIVPASDKDRANALTATGSFVVGSGIADYYSSLSGGVSFPALPNPNGATPAPSYSPNIDNGLVTYSPDGVLHAIRWQSYIVGLQYYLPPSGSVWISANYSHTKSSNAADYDPSARSKIYTESWWADGNVFVEPLPSFRVGAEYAYFHQTYADGTKAKNQRTQLSIFYIF